MCAQARLFSPHCSSRAFNFIVGKSEFSSLVAPLDEGFRWEQRRRVGHLFSQTFGRNDALDCRPSFDGKGRPSLARRWRSNCGVRRRAPSSGSARQRWFCRWNRSRGTRAWRWEAVNVWNRIAWAGRSKFCMTTLRRIPWALVTRLSPIFSRFRQTTQTMGGPPVKFDLMRGKAASRAQSGGPSLRAVALAL